MGRSDADPAGVDPWETDASWWIDVIADDPIYATDVIPLIRFLTRDCRGPWLDVGCGEGRAGASLPQPGFGCDISRQLLGRAVRQMPVVRNRVPDMRWLRSGALAGASLILVLEHLDDVDSVFAALHRVVRPGGHLAVVANHPAFTAPGAGPVVDASDGEVLWRWGPYFTPATVAVEYGGQTVYFHHRPFGHLLNAAARCGWSLEMAVERPLSPAAVLHEPGYAGQEQLPRLLGMRWRR